MIVKALADAVLISLAFILAYFIRFKILLFLTPAALPIFEKYFRVMVFVTLIWLAIFKLIGLYENKRFTALVDEIAALFCGVTLSTLILFGFLFLYREFWFSRLVLVNAWWLAFLLLTAVRVSAFIFVRALRRRGLGIRQTLIVGAGEMGQTLAVKMTGDKGLGYRVVGFLDDDRAKTGSRYSEIAVIGPIAKLKEIIKQRRLDEVIIASSKIPAEKTLDIITECERFGVEFKIVPGILELIASRVDADELAGIPLLTVAEIRLGV